MQLLAVGSLYVEALFLHVGGKGVYIVKKTGYILSVIISAAIFCVKRQESLMKAGYGKFGGQ